MKRRPLPVRVMPTVARDQQPCHTWHNGAGIEIDLVAQSLHDAAKILLNKLDCKEGPTTAWDVGPITLLYRQTLELQMKFVVGEGSRFMTSPTDHITLFKTHSLRWLAQIVCQIMKAVQWEAEFKCAGIASLAEFSAVIAKLEATEPISAAVCAEKAKRHLGDVPPQLSKTEVLRFVPTLDALIHLLAATADALAAEWDLRSDPSALDNDWPGGKPTIQ